MAMSDVVVVATLKVREDKTDEARQAFERFAASTRAEGNTGIRYYWIHRGVDDASTFVFVEHYDSQEAFDAHMGQPFIEEIGGSLGELLAEPPTVLRCEALVSGLA
jgi:quinol monooxygenase YgiN